MNFNFYIIRLV